MTGPIEKINQLKEELEKASRYMRGLSEDQQEMVERFSRALMKRFLHPTLRTLKTLPDDIEGDLLMGAASRLFGLDSKSSEQSVASKVVQIKGNNENSSG